MNRQNVFIHESAHISQKATIGEGSKIWINSQIRENVTIGRECIISKDTYIDHNVSIGNNVKIQNGVSVYNGVTIGDKVFIGPNAVFTNDYFPRAYIEDWKITETFIKEGVSIGANATIICGNTIGLYSMIGAGSVVNRDVADYELVAGNPIKHIGWVCECGKKLDNKYFCEKCNKTYDFLES